MRTEEGEGGGRSGDGLGLSAISWTDSFLL